MPEVNFISIFSNLRSLFLGLGLSSVQSLRLLNLLRQAADQNDRGQEPLNSAKFNLEILP